MRPAVRAHRRDRRAQRCVFDAALPVLITLGLAAPQLARAAEPPGALVLSVPQPGPTLYPLDARTLTYGVTHAARLLGPDGLAVAARVVAAPEGELDAHSFGLEETADGWRVLFDLGPVPVRHDRITIVTGAHVHAAGCRIEVGDDARNYRPLVAGDLYWIGRDRAMQRGSLTYPASAARFVAVHWPRAAGLPEFESVRVRVLHQGGHPPIEIELSVARDEHDVTMVKVPALAPPLIALRWEFAAGSAPRAVVVLRGADRRWQSIGWTAEHALSLIDPLPPATTLRLISATESTTPVLERAFGQTPRRWLLFDAPRAGRYTLQFGAGETERHDELAEPLGQPCQIATESELRSAAAQRLAGAADLEPRKLGKLPRGDCWPIRWEPSTGPKPLLLPLPGALLDALEGDTHQLRLISGGRAVPFLRQIDDAPSLALQRSGAALLDTPLPPTAGSITQLELEGIDPGRPGRELILTLGGERPLRWTERLVAPEVDAPLPHHALIALRPIAGQRRLTIEGPAPEELDHATLRLWREGEALLFLPPATAEVELCSGFEPDPAPFWDVEPLRTRLAHAPELASVVIAQVRHGGGGGGWSRTLLIVAEVLAAGVVLFVLWRATRQGGHNPGTSNEPSDGDGRR